MAKKLKKIRSSPTRLFIELLMPWVAMAIIALLMRWSGFSIEFSIIAALAVAIVITFAIGAYEKKRRAAKSE